MEIDKVAAKKALDLLLGKTDKIKKIQVGWESEKNDLTAKENSDSMFAELRIPLFCPRCGEGMPKASDAKAYRIFGCCLKCSAEIETKMVLSNQIDDFILKNAIEETKLKIKEIDEMIYELQNRKKWDVEHFVTENGEVEDWEAWGRKEKDLKTLMERKKFFEKILEKMENDLEKQGDFHAG